MPPLENGRHLLDLLFRWGPGKKDGPLEAPDIESWSRQWGIELEPWEVETLSQMSQAYMAELHGASKPDAPPPWPDAAPMWRWVKNYKAERALDKFEERQARTEKRKARNGDRQ